MSERFSYLSGGPLGEVGRPRQAAHSCTHARRGAGVRMPQTRRKNIFHMKKKKITQKPERCWLYGRFYPILGEHVAKEHPSSSDAWVSPKRGHHECEQQQPDNGVLGEKGTSGEGYGGSGATMSPAWREGTWVKVVLPRKAGHFNTALVCRDFVQRWHSTRASDFFQKAAHSLHKADTAPSVTCDLCFWSLLHKPASNAGKYLKTRKIKKKVPPEQQQQKSLTQQHPKKHANPQNTWSKHMWKGRRGTDKSAIKAEFVEALAAALKVYKAQPSSTAHSLIQIWPTCQNLQLKSSVKFRD